MHLGGSPVQKQVSAQSRGIPTIDARLRAVNDCSKAGWMAALMALFREYAGAIL